MQWRSRRADGERVARVTRPFEGGEVFARVLTHSSQVEPRLWIVWLLCEGCLQQTRALVEALRGNKGGGTSNQLRICRRVRDKCQPECLEFPYAPGALSGFTRMNGVEQMECRALCSRNHSTSSNRRGSSNRSGSADRASKSLSRGASDVGFFSTSDSRLAKSSLFGLFIDRWHLTSVGSDSQEYWPDAKRREAPGICVKGVCPAAHLWFATIDSSPSITTSVLVRFAARRGGCPSGDLG